MRRASPDQHSALHMVLIDIAMQKDWPPGSGNLHGPTKWWQLIVAAYDRLSKEDLEVLPAIDGVGFDGNGFDFVRGERRRRQLNSIEIGEIIEYAQAWAIDQGVRLNESKRKAA